MTHAYRAVQWNKHKRTYDALIAVGVVLFIALFVVVGLLQHEGDHAAHPVTLILRATSTCAITLLTIVLAIGPLARLSPRFNPLLYNRRHLGVSTFLVALVHGGLATFWYHGFGVVDPVTSVFTTNANYLPAEGQRWQSWLHGFPYQPLGVFALIILFLMAATSHDFWLKNLSPRVWKNLHTLVYLAYGLIVMHVTLGFLQDDVSVVYAGLLGGSAAVIVVLHVVAGVRENIKEGQDGIANTEWVAVAKIDDLEDAHGKVVCLKNHERIAVFRHGDKVSAVSNVCAHQNGPLGEGRIIDGCITCPWHGYQYRPEDGQSPPPYTETIPTYRVRVEGRDILVNPEALPPGTAVEPALIHETVGEAGDA